MADTNPTSEVVARDSTIAILLGASTWPHYSELNPSPDFADKLATSAAGFVQYLLDLNGLGLPQGNVLNLFDSNSSPDALISILIEFLAAKRPTRATRLVLAFIGHGNFVPGTDEYLLMIQSARKDNPASALRMADLAKLVKDKTPGMSRFVFLDACYSGSSLESWHMDSSLSAAMAQQAKQAFPHGTVLFCSSGKNVRSAAPKESDTTMFTGSLVRVLTTGSRGFAEHLSLEDVSELVWEDIALLHKDAVRPQLYDADSRQGRLSKIPFFPNPARRESLESRIERLDSTLRNIVDQLAVRSTAQYESGTADAVRQLQVQVASLQTRLEESTSLAGSGARSTTTNDTDWTPEERNRVPFVVRYVASPGDWMALAPHLQHAITSYARAKQIGFYFLLVALSLLVGEVFAAAQLVRGGTATTIRSGGWPSIVFVVLTGLNVIALVAAARSVMPSRPEERANAAPSARVDPDWALALARRRRFPFMGDLELASPYAELALASTLCSTLIALVMALQLSWSTGP